MKYNDDELYNPEVKGHFLEEYKVAEGTQRVFYYIFKTTSKIEKQMNKDLYQMTDEEIEKVLYSARKRTDKSMMSFFSSIKTYVGWCSNRYGGGDFGIFTHTNFATVVGKYISKSASAFYTQLDLFDYYEKFANKSDALIIQATYEGIRGTRMTEIFNMKAEHLSRNGNKYFIDLYDTEEGTERPNFEISKYLYDLIIEVDNEKTYTDSKGLVQELRDTPYVLKKTNRGKKTEDGRLDRTYLYNRITMYKELFETNHFRLIDVESSGIMEYLYELIKDDPNEVKEVTFEHLARVADKYNIGKYIHSNTLEETINYSTIKSRINMPFFEENYCKIKLPKK